MHGPQFGSPPGERFEVAPSMEEVQFFRENGFLAVKRLTTDAEIIWLRAIVEFIFSEKFVGQRGAPLDRSGALAPGEPSRLRQAFFPEINFPQLLTTQYWRNARRYASALLGIPEAELSSWGHLINKPPAGRTTPWHQDHAYWQPELDYHALGVWLPLQDVSVDMGAMQFIPGSHKRGLLKHRHEDQPQHNLLRVDEPFEVASAIACPLTMGGATFHHFQTLHYTAPNSTALPRLAYPIEFQRLPSRRTQPLDMPWNAAHRQAIGAGSGPQIVVADGQVLKL